MPPTLSYPGVYVEELVSSQHTITGVATSIAAFVGWAPQGPTDEAVMVTSMPEYEATFGGFVTGAYLAYAVSHFFGNGGQQAYIVRLALNAVHGQATWPTGVGVILYAKNPGKWGNALRVAVTQNPSAPNRCSLLVQLAGPNNTLTTVENYNDLSCASPDPRYIVTVINHDSNYLTFTDPATNTPRVVVGPVPAGVTHLDFTTLNKGDDGVKLVPGPVAGNFETVLTTAPGGFDLLRRVPIFNLLCVPGETDMATLQKLQDFCFESRAFLIVDAPRNATVAALSSNGPYGMPDPTPLPASYKNASYSAYYFPWVLAPDPAAGGRSDYFPPCGFVAGQYASTDTNRGVWKAPAGIATSLGQALALGTSLNDLDQGRVNPSAVNCLRTFRNTGSVIWGARTIAGADLVGSQWKYVPVRRLALYIESSLYDGTQWVVFEPNDEPLWGQIRLNVGAFLQGLFLQGAFAGTTPQKAFFVKCDGENNPSSSVALGVVNILVGFAPLEPAEFVVLQIQQIAGQTS